VGCTHQSFDTIGCHIWVLVLPDANYGPASPPQRHRVGSISADDALEFSSPVVSIRGRIGGVQGASMPEASVDEDSHTRCTE
jgi:hypothetical protein